jgi:hypothetical protein
MAIIVPDKTPVIRKGTGKVVGYVSNPNNVEKFAVQYTEYVPEFYHHIQHNPKFENGRVSYVEEIVFGTEE